MIFQEKLAEDTLLFTINQKKTEMMTLGRQYGLRDARTIQCSQELDDLLNQHLKKQLVS